MDKIDWKIAQELERDARISFAELSEKVGLSKSPCWTRVRDLQEKGVISGFAAQLEPRELGLNVQCHIAVVIRFDAHAEFEEAVTKHSAIFECHTTAGSSDYLLRVYARSVEHLDDLLRYEISKLPGVQSSSTTMCLKTIKRGASLAVWGEELSKARG